MTAFLTQHPHLKTIQELAQKRRLAVYLVGGFWRDYLLSRPCVDFDFAVERNALGLAKVLARRIQGAYVILDREHGCARVVKKEEGKILTFDFADYRAKSLRQDLAHRDFTINTIAADLKHLDTKEDVLKILTDYKSGQKDLKNKIIRVISAKSFQEDPLRLMRAFSLKAQLNFRIDPKTLAQIKKEKNSLKTVSSERVREELFKVFASPRAFDVLKDMDRVGLLEKVIPQITVMYNVTQGGYHHLDVWPHSLEIVAQLEKVYEEFKDNDDVNQYLEEEIGGAHTRRALLKFGALLHDIGKPQTKKKEDGRTSFHGHEHVGKAIVRGIGKILKLSINERRALEDMVRWHLRPGYLSNFKQPTERAVFRYFRDTREEAAGILLLSLADQRSTRGPLTTEADQKHHEKICLGLLAKYFEKKKEKPFVRLISGKDLIKKLKLKPAPLFAKILQEVEETQVLGKITTKEEALALASKIASSYKGPDADKF